MSEIRATTISDTTGTGPVTLTGQYASKMWINLNGTGTAAIRDSGNVSSITDVGTGVYDVNMATALTDANYSVVGMCSNDVPGAYGGTMLYVRYYNTPVPTSTYFRLASSGDNGASFDAPYVWASAIR